MLDETRALDALRDRGMRVTPQRRAVIAELCGDDSHPLAEDIVRRVRVRVPGVSVSTVYKIVAELAELGLVQRIEGHGAMRVDPDTSEHAHFSCIRCGDVVDIDIDEAVAERLRELAVPCGSVEHVAVELTGVCPSCGAGRR